MAVLFGEFEISPETYELRRAGRPVHLEPRVFEVLAYLVANRSRLVTKDELLERLWPGEFVSESALSRVVRDARRALGDTGLKAGWIQTVHGRGFRFAGDAQPARPRPPARPGQPSLIVLPFDDLSGHGGQEFFADGMTDALITELAKIASLRVVSRTSALHYKASHRTLPEIAGQIGVDFAVEGTVVRSGERVRVTAQLLRAPTDEHLWAEQYELELCDVLSLQAELARTIARAVEAQLTPSESERLGGTRPKVEPRVYLLELEGRHLVGRRNEEAFRKALACFRQAANLDPTYAPAQAGMAESYAMLGNYGISPPSEVHGPAREAAERALAIDPQSSDAHRALALLSWQFEFDWREAERIYCRALELDPRSPSVRWWYGLCQGIQGKFGPCLEELERAKDLDPWSLHIVAIEGWIHYFDRRFGEALPYYRGVLEVEPNHLMTRWFLGEALVELGEHEAARRELERALELSHRSSRLLGYLGYAHGRAGRTTEARALLGELEARRVERYVPRYFTALVHAGLGRVSDTLDELEQAWSERDSMLRDLRVDPPWECLHGERRYQQLLVNLGLR